MLSANAFRLALGRHMGLLNWLPSAHRNALNTMDNVIRPSFGGRQQPAGAEPPAYEDGYQPLYVYGQAAATSSP